MAKKIIIIALIDGAMPQTRSGLPRCLGFGFRLQDGDF